METKQPLVHSRRSPADKSTDRMGLCLMAMILGLLATAFAADPWIHSSWQRRVAITNLSPAIPGQSLRDFPVLIALTNAEWLTPSHENGGDITFAGVDGKQLFHEVEYYGKGGLQAWVCIPTLTNATTIYMYWSKRDAVCFFDGSNTTAALTVSLPSFRTNLLATNVWDANFVTVLHFASATSKRPEDSSRYFMNTQTDVGANIVLDQAGVGLGTMGNRAGACLGMGSTNVRFVDDPSKTRGVQIDTWTNSPTPIPGRDLLLSNRNYTESLWVKWTDLPSNQILSSPWPLTATNAYPYIGVYGFSMSNGFVLQNTSLGGLGMSGKTNQNGGASYEQGIKADMIPSLAVTNITNFGPGGAYQNWYRYTSTMGLGSGATFDRANWVNDTVAHTMAGPKGTTPLSFAGLFIAGVNGHYTEGGQYRFTPRMTFDEFRLSAVVRSSNWVLTEYSNTILSTNLALLNGVQADRVETLTFTGATNLKPRIPRGFLFRGNIPLGYDVGSVRVLISNANGESFDSPVVKTFGTRDWMAPCQLPPGFYGISVEVRNPSGEVATSENQTFQVQTASTLTIRTVDPSGNPWLGGRILGSPFAEGERTRLVTNNGSGTSVFEGMYAGDLVGLTNYTPVLHGRPAVATNFPMPDSDMTLIWTMDFGDTPTLQTNTLSGRPNPAVFLPSQASELNLHIPQTSAGALRVVLSAIPLAGGRKCLLYDDVVAPAFPYIQIPKSTLTRTLGGGIWILEYTFPRMGLDAASNPVVRRMLFLAP